MSTDTTSVVTAHAPGDQAPSDLAARRSAKGRGARVRRWVGGIALLAVAAGVIWAVWFSPLLAVRTVRVVGVEALDPEVVTALADVVVGTPLARVDVAGVTARVQGIPRVASVEVRRGFPHDLVLAVVERTPVAVVRDAKTFALVDATGTRFARSRTAAGLPVLSADDEAGVRAGLDVLVALPPEVRARMVTVTARSRDDVTLGLRSGATVRWGDASRAERKAAVLTVLLGRKASMYDVSAPDLPTTSQ